MGGSFAVKPYNRELMANRVGAACRLSIAVAIVLTLVAGCRKADANSGRGRSSSGPIPVTVARLEGRGDPASVVCVGSLGGDEETVISAKVAGRVSDVQADIGDRVMPGESLVQLDPTDYNLIVVQKELAVREALSKLNLQDFPSLGFDAQEVPTVQKARLQAENASGKLARGKQLHDQDPPLLSDQDFADLKTAADVADGAYQVELLNAQALLAKAHSRQADLALARQQLTDATVLVPHSVRHLGTKAATRPADKCLVGYRAQGLGRRVCEGRHPAVPAGGR